MTKDERNEIWTRNEIDSPCKKICLIHQISRLCIGCYRTAEEIKFWNRYSQDERNSLISELPQRQRMAIPKKRSGRANKVSQLRGKT